MAINHNWDCKTLEIHLNHTDSNNIAKEDVVFKVLWTLKFGGISEIFLPILSNLLLSTPLKPRLSLPSPGLNRDQAPSNHFNSDL